MATVTIKSGTAEELLAEQRDIELMQFLADIGASEEEAKRLVAKLRAQGWEVKKPAASQKAE